jgi:hypothetical protein
MKKKLFVLILLCTALATHYSAFADTMPAGTKLVVRTSVPISTHSRAGQQFTATLAQSVGGLSAGTRVTGLIQSSRARTTSRSNPLTLTLTSVSVNGRNVPIKTDSVTQSPSPRTTRQSRGNFTVGQATFPAGTTLEFRLSEPANL